jgi:phospholipid-binding lipoprotein MlaA
MIKTNYLLACCLIGLLVIPVEGMARGGGGGGGRGVAAAAAIRNQTVQATQVQPPGQDIIQSSPEVSSSSTLNESEKTSGITKQFNPNDPYEPFNRAMFNFNDFMDKAVMKPIAMAYNKIVPKPILKGISNIFFNIDTVPTFANDLLQANFYQGFNDGWRIIINSTVGIGGFFDVATNLGLPRNSEDLGLTFARWGWRQSDYLVLPFIGPSTVRDGLAWPINYQYLTIYPYIHSVRLRYSLYGLSLVSKRADLLRFQDVMEQAAIDKYVFMRDAYMQHRKFQMEQNDKQQGPSLDTNNNIEPNNDVSYSTVST